MNLIVAIESIIHAFVGQTIAFRGLSGVLKADGWPRDGQTTQTDRLSYEHAGTCALRWCPIHAGRRNMGMMVGGRGQKADINVTPMIDVLLVLIIIFLVITPSNERGLHALIPQQSDRALPPEVVSLDLVVSVAKDNVVAINQEPVDFAAL